ncbi:MAG: GAF domain-containing protein [Armatimonadota bacterium]
MGPEYQSALGSIRSIVAVAQAAPEMIEQVLRVIHAHLPKYQWVGIYLLHGETLDLGPHVGAATAHTRIPVGTGVCGTAVLHERNQIVEDVSKLSNYLACSATVRAEIVVLIWQGEKILGQIDADSDTVGAFTAEDERFLQQVAELLAPALAHKPADEG